MSEKSCSIVYNLYTTHSEKASVKGPIEHLPQVRNIAECGHYLPLKSDSDGQSTRARLTRHAIHNVLVTYGEGKSKIALIGSTISLFDVSGADTVLTSMATRHWVHKYDDRADLESILADGRFIAYQTPEAEAEASQYMSALREEAVGYDRKVACSVVYEHRTYEGGYLYTMCSKTKHHTNMITTGALVVPVTSG